MINIQDAYWRERNLNLHRNQIKAKMSEKDQRELGDSRRNCGWAHLQNRRLWTEDKRGSELLSPLLKLLLKGGGVIRDCDISHTAKKIKNPKVF